MTTERFLNTYHNASTAPSPDVPADLASFMLAADPVLVEAAELARILARAHQGAAAQLIGEGWAHGRKYFSLSEKYAEWADYRAPAKGLGIHAYAHEVSRPIRLTDDELRAHDEWRNFGDEIDNHPPMRGWTAQIMGSFRPPIGSRVISPSRTRPISSGWRRSRRRHSTRLHNSICPTIGGRLPGCRPGRHRTSRLSRSGRRATCSGAAVPECPSTARS
jgi:hypothetical protein